MEELAEAYRMLERARSLGPAEKAVLNYFIDNLSVGVVRAVKELKLKGVDDPEEVISRLVELGFLEDKGDCYNLAAPLRELVHRRGRVKV